MRRRAARGALIVVAVAVAVVGGGGAVARAQDRFEIQVYDAETAPAGGTGLELHVNRVAGDDAVRFTLEPHVGLTRFAELGAYVQTALLPDGQLDFAGLKIRLKVRVPRRLLRGLIGLALNGELSSVPPRYEPLRYGGELRPIIDLAAGRFYASVNPILTVDLAGEVAGHPQLEPAARAAVQVAAPLWLGVEYYGAFGPLDALVPIERASHRLLGAVDVDVTVAGVRLGVNVGVGAGFGAAERWVAKLIVGVGR